MSSTLPVSGIYSSVKIQDELNVKANTTYFMGNVQANNIIASNITVNGTEPVAVDSVEIEDANSNNSVTIQPPDLSSDTSYTLTLPTDDGDPNQTLTTDGNPTNATLTWTSPTGGTPTTDSVSLSRTSSIPSWLVGINGTKADIPFEIIDYVQGTDISASTTEFTVNTTGQYKLNGSVGLIPIVLLIGAMLTVVVNGTDIYMLDSSEQDTYGYYLVNPFSILSGSIILNLTAADTVRLRVYISSQAGSQTFTLSNNGTVASLTKM